VQRSWRIGIIGCGFIASEVHLPVLKQLGNVAIVAACDKDDRRLSHYGSLAGVAESGLYPDHRQMLLAANLDCAIVATPPSVHKEVVADCLNSGLGVLCEKPMAMSGDDALAMLAVASQCQRPLGVICNFLQFPEFVTLKQVMGELGPKAPRLITIRGRGLGMDAVMIQNYLGGRQSGFVSCDHRGGVLRDYGVHAIYVANYLLDAVPSAVTCVVQSAGHPGESVDTSVLCLLEYPTSHAAIDLSWEPRMTTDDRRFQRGSLDIDYDEALVEVSYLDRGDGLHAPALCVTAYDQAGKTVRQIPPASPRERLFASFGATFDRWFESGMHLTGPDDTARVGADAMVVVSACDRSSAARGTVRVEWQSNPDTSGADAPSSPREERAWQP